MRQHFQRTIGILTVQLTGSVLRRLHGFLQALGNAHETRAQFDNRGFGLLARAFDLLGPDRHGTEEDFIELGVGRHGAALSAMRLVVIQRLSHGAAHLGLLGAGGRGTGAETNRQQCSTRHQIGRTRAELRENPGNGGYDGNE
ncbi:hypothetical protein ALP85_01155 [Pseudomonas syringae pv. syringae]|nr:hypothetical protein ALP85_01155 [Pseudomonas syringae pv. syringae]